MLTEQAVHVYRRMVIRIEQGQCAQNIEFESQKEYRQAIWESQIRE